MHQLEKIRHSLAHLLAAAVLERDNNVKLGIGPVIENGFYYDILTSKPISEDELAEIEKRMREMAKQNLKFEKEEISAEKTRELFRNQPFKLELVEELASKNEQIIIYKTLSNVNGSSSAEATADRQMSNVFTDLCQGPHVENTKEIDPEAFKLTRLAGAYWKGSEKNQMLTRVYGVAFQTKEEMDSYFTLQEEAKKRDHRKLGKELKLFTIIDEIGPGLPLFYPNGAILRRIVENYIIEEQEKRGYQPIWIPHITKGKLYEISGHLAKYDAMYNPMKVDSDDYYIKPMNCPHFMMLYKTLPHSYKELPLRYTCTTTNYRYEKSGELSGLTRVRSLTQDDCHVFCMPNQIEQEIELMLEMIKKTYQAFKFENFWVRVSLRDPKDKEKYIGNDEVWETAENALRNVVKKTGWKFAEEEGEAAFYGPKLDFMTKDVLDREWQLSTIQLDFNLPERFELEYTSNEGKKERPVVIHRAILGSTERFLGIIIEHFAGAFPLWLSPVQVKILPIGEAHREYAKQIYETLKENNIRAELDDSDNILSKKIKDGKLEKVPYILVIGGKEIETKTVTVESRDRGKEGQMAIPALLEKLKAEINQKL